MLYNPDMLGSGRIAIKFKDGEKCVISKCYVQDKDALLLTCTENFMPVVTVTNSEGEKELIDFMSDTTFVRCYEIKVLHDRIELALMIQTNVCVEEDYDNECKFTNYYLSVAEPEEHTRTIFYNITATGIKNIEADLELFVSLLNEGIIKGREETLEKYDLLPEIRLYRGGKDKTKVKSVNKKIKYIR